MRPDRTNISPDEWRVLLSSRSDIELPGFAQPERAVPATRHMTPAQRKLKTTAINMPAEAAQHEYAGLQPPKSVPTMMPLPAHGSRPKQRTEPARTTKVTQKLVVFPDADVETEREDVVQTEGLLDDVRSLSDMQALPSTRRVSAYLTAESFRLRDLQDRLMKASPNFSNTRRFDEVLYAAYDVEGTEKVYTDADLETAVASTLPVGEVLVFDYGVVVIWGLEESDERRVLRELQPYEVDRLATEDVEVENFTFCHNPDRPPRLFNDIINLRSGHHMVKLTISHALAQSVKLAYFEELIESTIVHTRNIPHELSSTGTIRMSRNDVTTQIGELFIMRMNVNLVSNVLDTPEIFWSYPSLGPLYRAVRGYLEISQRVEVLNQRCAVLSDMLDMLRDHVNIMHSEKLEWIIIVLISLEIFMQIVGVLYNWFKGYGLAH